MHPLRQQIARLRRQIRRLAVVYGFAWLLIGLVGSVLVLGFADYGRRNGFEAQAALVQQLLHENGSFGLAQLQRFGFLRHQAIRAQFQRCLLHLCGGRIRRGVFFAGGFLL